MESRPPAGDKITRNSGLTQVIGQIKSIVSEKCRLWHISLDPSEEPVISGECLTLHAHTTGVTQELWQAVMGSNPSYFKGAKRPVECVGWDDCQTFIRKLNSMTGKTFRLPTEAEWEFAARGGNKSQRYKYSGNNHIDNVAWYQKNAYYCGSETKNTSSPDYGTHPVKTKSPNELGIYDMSGNVWEWCQDWFGSYSSSPKTNPTGPASGSKRVGRGGSWGDGDGDCRVSHRGYSAPGSRYDSIGFRLAL